MRGVVPANVCGASFELAFFDLIVRTRAGRVACGANVVGVFVLPTKAMGLT
jgi:hypothetical protein